jgi:Homeodomain-like domain
MAWELSDVQPLDNAIHERSRPKTIQAVIDRYMKPGMVAQRLRMSVRQIERLVIRYRADGPVGLISRHRHRTGNRALKAHVAERIIGILREQYSDFGPTLAAEKLQQRHGIRVAKETIRRVQMDATTGIAQPKRPVHKIFIRLVREFP